MEWYFLKYVTPFHYIAISKRTYNTNHNLCNNVKQRRDYSKMSYFIVRWRQNYFFPWNVHACGSKDILIVIITKPILLDRNIFYQTIVMFANSQSNKYAYETLRNGNIFAQLQILLQYKNTLTKMARSILDCFNMWIFIPFNYIMGFYKDH